MDIFHHLPIVGCSSSIWVDSLSSSWSGRVEKDLALILCFCITYFSWRKVKLTCLATVRRCIFSSTRVRILFIMSPPWRESFRSHTSATLRLPFAESSFTIWINKNDYPSERPHKNVGCLQCLDKEKTYFLCLSVCQSVRHHFALTSKSSGQKTVATRFSVLNSNLLIN